MDSKIPASFWDTDALSTPELLLTALWLRTHAGINLAGYAEISVRRFVFETHLQPKALDDVSEALGKGLVREGNGYWLRHFIADEFGRGQKLATNNMAQAVLRALDTVQRPWVALRVLEEYPELRSRWEEMQEWKGLPRPSRGAKAQRARARARAGTSVGAGDKGGTGGKVRPSQDEILAYAATLGAEHEVDAFFDHFEATGWRQSGGLPIRSWQAAFRRWVRRSADFAKKSRDDAPGDSVLFDPDQPNAHTGGAVEAV